MLTSQVPCSMVTFKGVWAPSHAAENSPFWFCVEQGKKKPATRAGVLRQVSRPPRPAFLTRRPSAVLIPLRALTTLLLARLLALLVLLAVLLTALAALLRLVTALLILLILLAAALVDVALTRLATALVLLVLLIVAVLVAHGSAPCDTDHSSAG